MNELKLNHIYQGDTLSILKTFPDESIDMCITSPPYFGLRSYLPKDHPYKAKEIGSEKNMEEHLKVLIEIIGEIKRVLKPAGSFWLNYGDCHASNGKLGGDFGKNSKITKGLSGRARTKDIQEKSLMMIPERTALRMLDQQGWILRSKIVWAKQIYDQREKRTKGSVMPTSVKDRFNTSWEYLYHFVKNKKYYFDLDAVRLPIQTFENRPDGITRSREFGYDSKFLKDFSPQQKQSGQRFNYRVRDAIKKQGQPQFRASQEEIKKYIAPVGPKMGKDSGRQEWSSRTPNWSNSKGKNLPNVWLIGTEPSKELHFARFPSILCKIPIKSSCPPNGIVLDCFSGSGTALYVARQLGRNFIGIELSEKYIKLAENRLAQ